jgi:hypothetical protein
MKNRSAFDAALLLRYAATPTCLVLALLNGIIGGPGSLCGAMGMESPIGGMATMYMVMALFHAGPWFRLLSNALIMKDL